MMDTLEAPAQAVLTTTAILERGLNAYQREYKAIEATGKSDYLCRKAGANAYRLAMPSTETLASTQALIACVAQGINLQVYEGHESTQPLYAAQVALAANKPPRPEKAPKAN
jgi:hypothetical protein